MTKDQEPLPKAVPEAIEKKLATTVPAREKSLTEREWKFVWEWASNDGRISLREAAIKAGYSPSMAVKIASRLVNPEKRPDVVAALQQVRKDLRLKYGTSFEKHMKDLMEIRDAAMESKQYSAALGAEYRRGQALGTIYVDRKEIRIGTIDSMSKEEVLKKLQELRGSLDVIDVDPVAPTQEAPALEHKSEVEDDGIRVREALRDVYRARNEALRCDQKGASYRDNSRRIESNARGAGLLAVDSD